ncbi:PDZ domain-containing protein [Nocardia stercoris]|uniref:PDZ domain-containing protein n=2 Tax=Nocardia stercoris TaxID=2483361 RepID=A0A3M2KR83_9NOCA|nr:PDZ domain-containing protein [Nocardia stercoris]
MGGPGGYAGWGNSPMDSAATAGDSAAGGANSNAMAQTTQLPLFPGAPAGPGHPGQPEAAPVKRRGRAGLAAAAVVIALIGGAAGGAVDHLATDHSGGSSGSNALSAPPGKTGPLPNAPAGTVTAVAQKVLPSVVMIQVQGQRGAEAGSGVILSADGLILTNNHVASGMGANAKMQVQYKDGTTTSASVVGVDPVSDLAVIKADNKSGLTPIDLGTSQNLQVGQGVVAVGAPLGLAGTVTTGIVSALNRPVSTSNDASNSQGTVISAVQTDAPINPGNSGGALVDMDGKLIGINTAIATMGAGDTSGQQSGSIGLGFAIPIDQARRVADQLIKTGHATYAQIGISVRQTDDVNGARVLDVIADGPAAKAGIPAGSIVTRIDDFVVDSGNGLIAAVRSHQPGDKVTVTYTDDKGQNPTKVDVVLAEAAADGTR